VDHDGCDATVSEYGTTASASSTTWSCGERGDSPGTGGVASSGSWGSGGGGMNSDGGGDYSSDAAGRSWFNGGTGGLGVGGCGDSAEGGFGGGGSGQGCHGGGGGGGYSGGEGGRIAGGGGSYNAGGDPFASALFGDGDGQVTIVYSGSVFDTCGNGVLEPEEEMDPPTTSYTYISIDDDTCRWDFDGLRQLYCNGGCTWAGGSSCDSADADIFCKLLTDNPLSTAISWTSGTALDEPGFPCPGYGEVLSVDRGVDVSVYYQDFSILSNHGPGDVIIDPSCTDP